MAEDKKKELIEKSAQEFQKLNEDNKMFILGYIINQTLQGQVSVLRFLCTIYFPIKVKHKEWPSLQLREERCRSIGTNI